MTCFETFQEPLTDPFLLPLLFPVPRFTLTKILYFFTLSSKAKKQLNKTCRFEELTLSMVEVFVNVKSSMVLINYIEI